MHVLQDFISELILMLTDEQMTISQGKEINYGKQVVITDGNEEIPLNIYSSKKKGISTVIGGSLKNVLRPRLQKILNHKIDAIQQDHKWDIWAGTDETGKGDFFGPLIVCGFICTKEMVLPLREIGVKDSKLLKEKQIIDIAKKVYGKYPEQIELLRLMPEKYNQLYANMKQQNKKLNELLAWMHGRVILNLQQKHNFDGVVVDKFASERVVRGSIKGMDKINLLLKTSGEDDVAVATASILARYQLVMSMRSLSRKFRMDIPRGASKKVLEAGQMFANQFGKTRLNEVAKTHFVTYDKIS